MKLVLMFLIFVAVNPVNLHAARCKVDGEWYAYDSPKCQQGTNIVEESNESSEHQAFQSTDVRLSNVDLNVLPHYLRNWNSVRQEVVALCKKETHYNYQPLRCIQEEERSFWAMRGSYELPDEIADRVKIYCMSKHQRFTSQARCLEMELRGYSWLTSEHNMSAQALSMLKDECIEKADSFSDQASCIRVRLRKRQESTSNTPPRNNRIMPRTRAAQIGNYPPASTMVLFKIIPSTQRPKPPELAIFGPSTPLGLPDRTELIGLVPPSQLEPKNYAAWTEEQIDYFELNAGRSFIEGVGSLAFHSPEHVDPVRGALFNSGKENHAVLNLFVRGGHRYLLDFAVNSENPGRYVVTSEGGETIFEDNDSFMGHVTVILDVAGLGWTNIKLSQANGTGFFLNSIGVTVVDRSNPFLTGTQ